MIGGHTAEDRGPWFEVAGHPVSAPLALVGGSIVSMLLTTAALALNHHWAALLQFSSEAVLQRGEVWRVVSYVLWNPPSLSLALDMLMLWWFGRELEAYFGRRIFLKLCLGIVLAPPVAGVAAGLLFATQWVGLPGTFALFVAFATMAPSVTLLFGLSAKWTALIFLGIQLLSCVAEHAWGQLIHSLASAGFAFAYVRLQQGRWEMPGLLSAFKRKPLRVLPAAPVQKKAVSSAAPAPSAFRVVRQEPDAIAMIDTVLEKIGRTGLASLTEAEKAQLEEAREVLLRKDPPR
ncbi:MAG: Rhomboid family protein [Verrucomicrobia bacterium]|nr:MAG: Rhomboid family protein [Verrucomicrobiota bacterium]